MQTIQCGYMYRSYWISEGTLELIARRRAARAEGREEDEKHLHTEVRVQPKLIALAGWTIFLLPVGLLGLATYTPRQEVGVKRSMAARKIGAGWVRSNPLVR